MVADEGYKDLEVKGITRYIRWGGWKWLFRQVWRGRPVYVRHGKDKAGKA